MAARVNYKASVRKDIKQLDRSAVSRILEAIEGDLADHPGKDKALKGRYTGLYSYRVGDWRIIYSLIGEAILVLRIAHRKESYRE
ncbi:MAG: addiction module toxin RelE [Spirochaetae bacterium HGW-Spirochaetae-7]|jgi:mRNA interferase RelE/StbE|nr:MAG: addiction module toxin RelE [Spirochaetae bacterium HGW-Spirochaetae-7]